MLLPLEQVRQGLLHPDQDVRDSVAQFFSHRFARHPAVMPLVIRVIEQFGWEQAFSAYHFFPGLLQTELTIDWIIYRLANPQPFSSKAEEHGYAYLRSSLICSDPALLNKRRSTLSSIASLDQAALDLIDERIELASLSPGDLWRRLELLCRNGDRKAEIPPEDMIHICDIVRALSRHTDRREDLVLAILSGDAEDLWPPGLGVRLAGELRIESAIPQLLAMLNDDDVWVFEECRPALVNIGTDEVVRRLGRRYPYANCDFRNLARSVLAKIYSDFSVTTRLELVQSTSERFVRGELLASILKHFAAESVEPARSFVLEAPLDEPGLAVRKCLLTACKLIGSRFSEIDDWLEDSKNDEEYRRRWISQRHERLGYHGSDRARAATALLKELCRTSVR